MSIKIAYIGRLFDKGMFTRELIVEDLIMKYYDTIETLINPDVLFCSDRNNAEFLDYSCKKIFITEECVFPNFNDFDYAFTFQDDKVYGKNYRLPVYYKYIWYNANDLLKPKDARKILSEKVKFCNFIVSYDINKKRNDFTKKMMKYKAVDCPGKVLNNMPMIAKPYPSQGWDYDKIMFQRLYKFTICFENQEHPGYTTEKIVHAMLANTIPIYAGNPYIQYEFNPNSFINANNFNSLDDLVEYVKEVDNDDKLYCEMLSQPWFIENKIPESLTKKAIKERFDEIFFRNIIPVAKNIDIVNNGSTLEIIKRYNTIIQAKNELLQQNRWYRFGQLSRKRKIWVMGKVLSKKFKVYRILKPLVNFLKGD